jgi:hypothetical protein
MGTLRKGCEVLTLEEFRSILGYDPVTGNFEWLRRVNKMIKPGRRVGSLKKDGYIEICVLGNMHKAHHFAWYLTHGVWPKECIDHKDGNRANNILSNLREATHRQNTHNKKMQRSNTIGFKGVRLQPYNGLQKRYGAVIRANGKVNFLGSRPTPEEAHKLYCAAARKYFGEFARTA